MIRFTCDCNKENCEICNFKISQDKEFVENYKKEKEMFYNLYIKNKKG